MLNRNVLLKISEEGIEVENKSSNMKYKGINPLKNIEGLNIKNKNVYIIVEDEEVYIKLLKLPLVSKWDMNHLIRNELIFLYGKRAKSIFYTYTVLNKNIEDVEVLVFCINFKKTQSIEKIINNNKLKSINLIQFTILNYFKSKIQEESYTLIFKDNNKIYFLGISYGKLVANRIINVDKENYEYFLMDSFNYIIDRIKKFHGTVNNIYGVNLEKEKLGVYMQNHTYEYIDLGSVDKDKIIEYFSIKRK